MKNALEPILAEDVLLVTDSNACYSHCAEALGVNHEALNLSKGERVRGPLHIQTASTF